MVACVGCQSYSILTIFTEKWTKETKTLLEFITCLCTRYKNLSEIRPGRCLLGQTCFHFETSVLRCAPGLCGLYMSSFTSRCLKIPFISPENISVPENKNGHAKVIASRKWTPSRTKNWFQRRPLFDCNLFADPPSSQQLWPDVYTPKTFTIVLLTQKHPSVLL